MCSNESSFTVRPQIEKRRTKRFDIILVVLGGRQPQRSASALAAQNDQGADWNDEIPVFKTDDQARQMFLGC